jgi:hypothetical protein
MRTPSFVVGLSGNMFYAFTAVGVSLWIAAAATAQRQAPPTAESQLQSRVDSTWQIRYFFDLIGCGFLLLAGSFARNNKFTTMEGLLRLCTPFRMRKFLSHQG